MAAWEGWRKGRGGCEARCAEICSPPPAPLCCSPAWLCICCGVILRVITQVVDFYEFYEGLQEGWDGPALLVFSDGKRVGARLDRNGLRPARFWRTADDTIYVASEVGVLGDAITNASNVVAKGRLGPGQMVCADLVTGVFAENAAISRAIATRQPYKEWLSASLRRIEQLCPPSYPAEAVMEPAQMLRLQVGRMQSCMLCACCVRAVCVLCCISTTFHTHTQA